MNFTYDVFLSYHGGQSNSINSSYRKAEELKQFFEKKGLKVFLCKDVASSDFYDAINHGILGSRHFILVACDKNMLSEWVYDEVKQFDSLRKNGEKPNGMMGAYVFGNLQPSDLYKFNAVFSSIDIKSGEDGFEALFRQISVIDGASDDRENAIDVPKKLALIRYLDLTNFEVERKIVSCIKGFDSSERDYWVKYVMELFGFYNVLSVFDYTKRLCQSANVLVVRLYRHYILNQMAKESEIKPVGDLDYMILLADDDSGDKDAIVDFRNGKFITVDGDTILRYENGAIHVSSNQATEVRNRLSISSGGHILKQLLIPPQEGDEDVPVLSVTIDERGVSPANAYLEVQRPEFLSFIIHSIAEKFITEKWIDKDTSEYFDYVFTEPYDKKTAKTQFDQLYRKLIEDESSISMQYSSFKRTGAFTNNQNDSEEDRRYHSVIEKIKNFYLNKDQNSLIDAISLLELERNAELRRGSHYKQQSILLIISELVMNNMYSYENDQTALNGLIEDLRTSKNREVISDYSNLLYTMMLSIQKEMVFSGMYAGVSNSLQSALNVMLGDMSRQIDSLKALDDAREIVLSQLFLLHRQRAVIWEHLGDSSSEYEKRMDYYRSWRDDTLAAINYGKEYEPDREILGCAYLNYASSLNRLAGTHDATGRKESYAKCLENLDVAYNVLRGNCAKRYIGYVHLHRADCYAEMFESGLYDNGEVVRKMNISSRKAHDIFKDTQDLIGRGWSLRIMAKAIICSDGEGLKIRLVDGLNKLKVALAVDTQACVVKEMSRCVKDFSEYLKMIEENMLSAEMEGLIKQIFAAELEAFVTLVRDVDIDYSDISAVQDSLKLIMDKLQE